MSLYSQGFLDRMDKARARKPPSGGKLYGPTKVRYVRFNPRNWEHIGAYALGAWRVDCEETIQAFRDSIFGAPEPLEF